MRTIFTWLSVALLASASAASAQTHFITAEITAGTFNVDASGPSIVGASYDLSGPGVHIVADGVEPGVVSGALQCDTPGCQSGDVFTLHANFSGSNLGIGVVVVDGQRIAEGYVSGTMEFATGALTIPRGNRKHLVLSTPFTLGSSDTDPTVTLHISVAPELGQPPNATVTLYGGGMATAFFERQKLRAVGPERLGRAEFFYHLVRVIYSFDMESAP